ncbi:UDP-glucosyltransferase 2-like isoform X2 [Adelges cooleyi]|uniref:UDP-glucosyltransferase 2-like isoform X2 n=1 Tax=Adelges cooleyi TaxID=133065 RepID=UPI00217F686E|nr:UDP-glucosyltransferase 2-like isoform X2 [Adelges cooleyi]
MSGHKTLLFLTVLVLGTSCGPAGCSKILAVVTIPGKSHWNFMGDILRTLSGRGHQVTVFTPFAAECQDNFTVIDTSAATPVISNHHFSLPELLFLAEPVNVIPSLVNVSRFNCDAIYSHEHMKQVLSKGQQSGFDVVITEPTISECVSYVATKLGLPLIYVVPSPEITYMTWDLMGYVANPTVTSHLLAWHAVPKTFSQRLQNIVLVVRTHYKRYTEESRFKIINPLPSDDVEPVKCSLIFSNTHYITEPSRPFPPNFIHVGGIHIRPAKKLPKDILEFIENSPHGVIYFTFGSVVSMSTLPENLLNAFKEALAQVPQRVLWKYEGEMKNKPANVMTSKWFPQRDILLHPNVKLFISHGGISSVYEAVDAGVPVLGFPLFYDQPRNIANLVDAGMALSMDLFTVSKEPFLNAVLELINNQNYTINAKITSERFKDRPMTPAESVIYWTEYVLRHKGAPHLRSQALNLTWYQYYLLDVIAAILVILSVILYVIYKTLKVILQFVLKRPNKLKSKSE